MNPAATSELASHGSCTPEAVSLPQRLREASQRIAELGAEFDADRIRLEELQRRLREQRCHLAVLGQFKRGKSTLVNALLGEAVLPAAVVPLTSIPTFLYGGEEVSARVRFENGHAEERLDGAGARALAEFLARFVTEGANPHNRLGVRTVEVAYPASVLRQGLARIDTPGIGSTFRHNTEATINFLPRCDGALRDAVPILTLAQLVGNGSRVWLNRADIDRRVVGWYALGAVPLLRTKDHGVHDYKVLGVPNSDPLFAEIHDLGDVPKHYLCEVEHFVATYKHLEGVVTEVAGWAPARDATVEVEACVERFVQRIAQKAKGGQG